MRKIAAVFIGLLIMNACYADSPLTGNIGVASNYIWRGQTQTNDEAAVSGGIDYAHASGIYVGTWGSNLSATSDDAGNTTTQYEEDYYLGYSGKAGPVSYDVSYIMYTYPVGKQVYADFQEIDIKVGYGPVTLLVAPTVGKESDPANTGTKYESDMYMNITAKFEIKKDLMLGLVYGKYDIDEAPGTTNSKDYSHYQVSLSKGEFVFAYDVKKPDTADTTGVADAPRITVLWKKSFDL